MAFLGLLIFGTAFLVLNPPVNARMTKDVFDNNLQSNDLKEDSQTADALVQSFEGDFELEPEDPCIGDDSEDNDESEDHDKSEDNDESEDNIGLKCWHGHVAFSAYLSAKRCIQANHRIRFDRVLLNYGRSYRSRTGVFRAPVSGVYSFTFVIAQYYSGTNRANLVVNGRPVVGAIAEAARKYHDVQGTNTANVYLRRGSRVWVQVYSRKGYFAGNSKYMRYTSFSGHLLFKRH